MAFPAIKAVSGTIEESAYLVTDIVVGTRYAGKMYNKGMRDAYKDQLAASYDEEASIDQSKWSAAQKAEYANA